MEWKYGRIDGVNAVGEAILDTTTEIATNIVGGSVLNKAGKLAKPVIKAGAAKFSKKFLKSSAKERFARNLSARYNQVPYDPKNAQNLAYELFGSNKFTRSTVPVRRMPNVRLAGQCKERTIIIDPETQETLVQRIVFDNRGFPIFDPYVKVETRITGDLSKMSREAHMRMAARQLRRDIEEGKCLKGNLLMLNGMTSSRDLKK